MLRDGFDRLVRMWYNGFTREKEAQREQGP